MTKKTPYKGPGADSEEKRAPVSDIDIAVADSLKVLDLKRPIREATYLLRDNEMTRKVQAGLPLQGFGDGPGSRPPDIVCHRASLYKAGANGTFPSAWLREVAAPAGKNGLALGKAEEL